MPALKAQEVTFLELRPAVLCIECELISYNNTERCLACGSRAVLSLSRVLGGSLRQQKGVSAAQDCADRLVSDLLDDSSLIHAPAGQDLALVARSAMFGAVEKAMHLTGAEGAALGLYQDGHIVCTAQAGDAAPPLGARVSLDLGISGACVRAGRTMRSDGAERDTLVDRRASQALGVESVVAAPMMHLDNVFGILEVLSPRPRAFNDEHVATVQSLAALMVVGLMRLNARSRHARTVASIDATTAGLPPHVM
ncbi:MAG TPA: GAF domain-containing protein [Clostridia bacterium]|nr:GAF domain-containing protein [Clostridia bacterium]